MADSPPASFTERVRGEVDRLRETGLSKKAIAARAGIARSVLDRYERGGMPESPSRLAALARAFGCSMDYLWGRADQRRGIYTPDVLVTDEVAALLERMAAELRATSPGEAAAAEAATDEERDAVVEEVAQEGEAAHDQPPARDERRAGGRGR